MQVALLQQVYQKSSYQICIGRHDPHSQGEQDLEQHKCCCSRKVYASEHVRFPYRYHDHCSKVPCSVLQRDHPYQV